MIAGGVIGTAFLLAAVGSIYVGHVASGACWLATIGLTGLAGVVFYVLYGPKYVRADEKGNRI